MVMEVHSSDPQQPASPIILAPIHYLSPTVPEDILRPRARSYGASFPYHAIAYLDTLHDAEVRGLAHPQSYLRAWDLQSPSLALCGWKGF